MNLKQFPWMIIITIAMLLAAVALPAKWNPRPVGYGASDPLYRTQNRALGAVTTQRINGPFIAGQHYRVFDPPISRGPSAKIEIVELFLYGCPHCYEFEPLVTEWAGHLGKDVNFRRIPAVWNPSMKLFAQAFFTARELDIAEKIHLPLFNAVIIDQQIITTETDLADFFTRYDVDKIAFNIAFHSAAVELKTRSAESGIGDYQPAGVPELIVNGKYRIDRMRAGGLREMLAVADFLVQKERDLLPPEPRL